MPDQKRWIAGMLQGALIWLQARPTGNGSRITAIRRELRRREKKA